MPSYNDILNESIRRADNAGFKTILGYLYLDHPRWYMHCSDGGTQTTPSPDAFADEYRDQGYKVKITQLHGICIAFEFIISWSSEEGKECKEDQ